MENRHLAPCRISIDFLIDETLLCATPLFSTERSLGCIRLRFRRLAAAPHKHHQQQAVAPTRAAAPQTEAITNGHVSEF